jgi:UDP-glucuronate decarboxylase
VLSPINLGNPHEFTMQELAETVLEITNSKSKIIFQPLPSDDPKQRNPNIERARKELDWEPQIDLQSGLTRTVEYFQGII